MRAILAAALVLGLSGCGGIDFYGDSDEPDMEVRTATVDRTGTAAQPPGDAAPAAESAPLAAEPAPTPPPAPMVAAESEPVPVTSAPTTPSAHCTRVARQRATDAAYAGEDMETQETVYNRSYADCLAWDRKHAS